MLALIGDYVDLERAILAERSEPSVSDPLWLMPEDRKAVDTTGRRVRLDRLTPGERRKVLIGGPGRAQHALLWLTEGGQPVPSATWEAAFRRACARCRRFGIDLDVTPHTLRHVFAVNMLSMLTREQIGTVFDPQDRHGAAYRRILGDPLQKLQHLLGHVVSPAPTFISTASPRRRNWSRRPQIAGPKIRPVMWNDHCGSYVGAAAGPPCALPRGVS
ncbi:hypothetical protein [Mesorhizobium sp. M0244]|uniref:hypothetical protein n=1 Tax=unclassified Mesorhizobium TaxID=325217 RepID=UPI0033376871